VQKKITLQLHHTKRQRENLPHEKPSRPLENGGGHKKMKNPINLPKLQGTQSYPTSIIWN
jgi:hypothetical protein